MKFDLRTPSTAKALAALAVGALVVWNGIVTVPVALEQQKDAGRTAYVLAYRSWLLSPTDLTVNLVHVGADATPVDLFAALGSASDGLQNRTFSTVHLNRWFSPRLLLDGASFAATSREYGSARGYMDLGSALQTTNGQPLKPYSYSGGGFLGGIQDMTLSLDAANQGASVWATGN